MQALAPTSHLEIGALVVNDKIQGCSQDQFERGEPLRGRWVGWERRTTPTWIIWKSRVSEIPFSVF